MLRTVIPVASRRVLEEQIKKLKSEKSSVHSDLLHAEERSGSLEQDLEQLQQQNDRLTEAKADLEVRPGELSHVYFIFHTCGRHWTKFMSTVSTPIVGPL